ncbi:MAG: insulinase family protein [Bacteroidetes bacterium]|nr:insulinase family protein [Bacteroidota bacterium]
MMLDRETKPLPSDEIKFSLPEIEKFKLENELEVFFINKSKLPIIQLNLIVNAGSVFDANDKKGLSNLYSMTVDEGAGNYSSLELSDEFETLGTHFNVSSSEDHIYFSLQSLKENFERSLELLSMVIISPHLEEKDFLREQRKIITRLLQQQDEPDEIADLVFEYNVFGKSNPYAFPVIGYEDSVENISLEDIKKFHSSFIFPNNSALIVVGDITKDELQKSLNNYFKGWKSKTAVTEISFPQIPNKKNIFLVDKKGSVQSEIRIGHISTKRKDNDYFPKLILNTILGGQFTSRINLNLREKKGYTYGAHSRFNYLKDCANFYITTSVASENTANAVKEIFNELNEIRNGVTPDELEFAKSSLIRKFPSNFETYKQIASNLIGTVIHSLPEDYFNTYIENVSKITIEEVNSAAEKYILPNESIIVIVGSKEILNEQLSEIENVAVTEVDFRGDKVS